jgi:Uma2 family endonuclease
VTSVLPELRSGFTIDDLADFPSDGNRYELIEGSLHVTPAPIWNHQRIVVNLMYLLRSACPPEREVLVAPFDVVLGPDTMVEPDVLVTRPAPGETKRLEGPPLLVVEVLSPTTRLYDLGTKMMAYRQAGVPAHWAFDPLVPSLTERRWDGDDEQVRVIEADEEATFDWPFPVTVVPARLLLPNG